MKKVMWCSLLVCAIALLANESQAGRLYQLSNNSNHNIYMRVWGASDVLCSYAQLRPTETQFCDLRSDDRPDHIAWRIVYGPGVGGPEHTDTYPSTQIPPASAFICFDVNGKPQCYFQ